MEGISQWQLSVRLNDPPANMALPFIVGPHQCSLAHGPDGYPQVEVTFRLRLPVAEFIDAMPLSLADSGVLAPLQRCLPPAG